MVGEFSTLTIVSEAGYTIPGGVEYRTENIVKKKKGTPRLLDRAWSAVEQSSSSPAVVGGCCAGSAHCCTWYVV